MRFAPFVVALLLAASTALAQDAGTDPPAPRVEEGIVDTAAPRSQPTSPLVTPRPVYVGIYLNAIPSLDLEANRYLADFYLWFRWQGDDIDPSHSYEFMNAIESWNQLHAPIYVDDEGTAAADDLGEGWRYQVFHVQGYFGHAFDVRAYPFDSQEIVLMLEDTDAVVDDMIYVADDSTGILPPRFRIPGWEVGRVRTEIIEQSYPTNFGDTRRPSDEDHYSRFRYSLRVTRPVVGYVATTLVPIGIVMLITMVMFLVHPRYFEGRLGLGITSLISAVALQLTAEGNLPSTGYLVLLDHVYNLAYLVIFLSLLASVASVRAADANNEARSKRIDRGALLTTLVLFFGGTGLLVAFGR
jgi:hypothetical protein